MFRSDGAPALPADEVDSSQPSPSNEDGLSSAPPAAPSGSQSLATPEQPKKKRSFLQVPSRTSSRASKNQSEMTADTLDDSRNTAGSSRTNLTAGRRNPSKTSSKRSLRDHAMSLLRAEQSRSGGPGEEPHPAPEKKLKSSRLLAIISCCSVASRDKDDARPAVKTTQNRQPAKAAQPVIEKTDSGAVESSTAEPRDSEYVDEKARLDADVTAKARTEETTVSEDRITETSAETDPVRSLRAQLRKNRVKDQAWREKLSAEKTTMTRL